jgi:hypothetical protein
MVRARVNAARRADRYQSIADTIVQLFSLHASGVIASSQAIAQPVLDERNVLRGTALCHRF